MTKWIEFSIYHNTKHVICKKYDDNGIVIKTYTWHVSSYSIVRLFHAVEHVPTYNIRKSHYKGILIELD